MGLENYCYGKIIERKIKLKPGVFFYKFECHRNSENSENSDLTKEKKIARIE